MGFPNWTLYGMGAAALAALLTVGLAYLAQSPATLRRLGLDSLRLDKRIRGLTGWGVAFILLAIGFFAAGVPLDGAEPSAATEDVAEVDDAAPDPADAPDNGEAGSLPEAATATLPQVSSGAMGSQPPEDTPETEEGAVGATPTSPVSTTTGEPVEAEAEAEDGEENAPDDVEDATSTPTPTPSAAPTATPSPTATPRPTQTPTPTVSPTPISGETGVISTAGSTLWVRRSPGGQELVLVRDGDVVLLHAGRANQAGILWREISTLDGVRGWVQDDFLDE